MEPYSQESIVVLSGLEAVRRRPGMFIGGIGPAGLHNLLWEIVGNAVDEHLRGRASYVRVQINGDAISVDDDGCGIPVDPCPHDPAKSVLELVLTTLHGSVGFRPEHVHVGPNLFGAGAAVVNALSERLDAEVWRNGRHYQQRYARGVALGPVRDVGPAMRNGTRITFRPDFTIFEPGTWQRARIKRRLREIAAMCSSFTTILDHTAVRCPDGLADHVRYLARHARPLCEPLRIVGARDGVEVEVAVLWTDAERPCVRGFVGTSQTRCGTHIEGLAEGLRRFATGVYVAWYPIKDPKPVARFHSAVAAVAGPRLLRAEVMLRRPVVPRSTR